MRANQIARISSDFKMYVIKSESSDKLLLKSDNEKSYRFINLALNQADSINCPFSSRFAKVSRFLKPGEFGIGVTNTNAKNPVGNRL